MILFYRLWSTSVTLSNHGLREADRFTFVIPLDPAEFLREAVTHLGLASRHAPGALMACLNCVVPKGTRIYFLLYPALRPRLRAGLN